VKKNSPLKLKPEKNQSFKILPDITYIEKSCSNTNVLDRTPIFQIKKKPLNIKTEYNLNELTTNNRVFINFENNFDLSRKLTDANFKDDTKIRLDANEENTTKKREKTKKPNSKTKIFKIDNVTNIPKHEKKTSKANIKTDTDTIFKMIDSQIKKFNKDDPNYRKIVKDKIQIKSNDKHLTDKIEKDEKMNEGLNEFQKIEMNKCISNNKNNSDKKIISKSNNSYTFAKDKFDKENNFNTSFTTKTIIIKHNDQNEINNSFANTQKPKVKMRIINDLIDVNRHAGDISFPFQSPSKSPEIKANKLIENSSLKMIFLSPVKSNKNIKPRIVKPQVKFQTSHLKKKNNISLHEPKTNEKSKEKLFVKHISLNLNNSNNLNKIDKSNHKKNSNIRSKSEQITSKITSSQKKTIGLSQPKLKILIDEFMEKEKESNLNVFKNKKINTTAKMLRLIKSIKKDNKDNKKLEELLDGMY